MTENTTYNPMSKEFQEEAKRLGLTGYQLRQKYEKKGKYLEKGIYKDGRSKPRSWARYTDEELSNFLRQFEKENGRSPTAIDFRNNPEYPSLKTYQTRFGSWSNALKLVGLDVDSMVKQGVLETSHQKARLSEIKVINHFKQHPIDLAGENCLNPCDGMCPNGKTYDVKSSKLYIGGYYIFSIRNKYKEEIEIFYLLAFNSDWTKLEYAWIVPGEMIEKDIFYVGPGRRYELSVENMKRYDITNKFRELFV